MEPLITPWDPAVPGEECEGNESHDEDSPLVQALREHFTKYYAPEARYATPYASRNVATPPLNLEFLNSQSIVEMEK
jgi:hypothetical protein